MEKNKSLSPFDAVTEAAALRLRPIVMTTIPIIIGFIPLVLNLAGGGEMLQPMAVAVIGGLLFEIFVVLFLLPCLYIAFSSKKSKNTFG